MRAQVTRLRLESFITFHGARPQSDVKRYVQGASAIAIPCIVGEDGNRDGLPTVLLEAMALGTPCVSTDVTGIPEILIDEQTGLLVEQRDPQALATAMLRLLDDGDLRCAWRELPVR
ncbi:MAG: glycosyltransferase family 4 protein [Chloroflexi bacterium]|nr:glycosyltransferase family 4 protein [Chloroflexota bacterium]